MNPFRTRPLRRVLLGTVATVSGVSALLALKPHTQTTVTTQAAAQSATPSATPSATEPSSSASSSASASASASASSGAASTTKKITGDAIQTRYGPVQVQITLTGGKLTAVDVLQVPEDNPKDQQINDYAVPVLTQETLTAQSASIDSVSGATYTSEGYITSLQSALDKSGN
ncbi:FMN-binding protein [Streptomyces sp. NBC_01537]|uniref:FMN-binding protein n=1 Tax=Streptomyces sp. NBC_01537 TaxID=2903896 RepID=UPI003863B42E